jgi:hypothetical protein
MPVFNGTSTGKYELTLTLDAEQAADADSNGLSITRSNYQGNEQVKCKLKTKFPLNSNTFVNRYAKPFVDSEGKPKEIPRGSKVAVFFTTKPYEMAGKKGITNYLQGVQVIDENSSIEFEEYEEPIEDFDGEF